MTVCRLVTPTAVCFWFVLIASGRGGDVDFSRDIRPILSDKCFRCHGPDAQQREADLRLDVESIAKKLAITPGDLKKSELHRRIHSDDPDEIMPPADSKLSLSVKEKQLLDTWITAGAPYAVHWAFKTPGRPELPKLSPENQKWARNDIDYFVAARLTTHRLRPSPEASRQTLIRRATLDLTGLPPMPDEVAKFVADNSPAAYQSLLDRLLASSRYGEQMASFWLDAARYADTAGYQNDRYRYHWVWRDWVIKALNDNKPFDQFVIEQLSGDMLPEATLEQQVATAFCRNHRINSEAGSIAGEWHVENIVDRVDTMGTVFLGLTIGCARCHDHKYDPITQKEYYRLFAYFNNVPEWGIGPNNGNSPPFIEIPKSWPNLSAEENHLIVPGPLAFQGKGQYSGGVVRPQPGSPTTLMVMQEMEKPRPTYLLRRGQYNLPDKSEILEPGVPVGLGGDPKAMPSDRLALARWLVHPDHPLTARVTVNRYWQALFGVGLVKTSENFGVQGDLPSHPLLLDYLATEFVSNGWNVKQLHKTILMSATYRQSSRVSEQLSREDPENRLLSRGARFRLRAFALRDQALLLSGLLVEQLGGPSVKPYMPPKIWKSISNNQYQQDQGDKLYRRSLYTYWRRTIPPPMMANFNAAEREVCIVRKEKTNTPLQALTLMNNKTFVEAARFMAQRILREGGAKPRQRLSFAFRLATSRMATDGELAILLRAYGRFHDRYRHDTRAAEQLLSIGEGPPDKKLDAGEHAAMTMIASLLLNLDETITKE